MSLETIDLCVFFIKTWVNLALHQSLWQHLIGEHVSRDKTIHVYSLESQPWLLPPEMIAGA